VNNKLSMKPPDGIGPALSRWLGQLVQRLAVTNTRTIALTPGEVGPGSTLTVTAVVEGLTTDDVIMVRAPGAHPTGIIQGGDVRVYESGGTKYIAIRFANVTVGGLTPVAGNYLIAAVRL